MKKTYCKVTMMVISLFLTVTLASPAIAETYTYTGDPFSHFEYGATSPPYINFSGSFTYVPALAPGTDFNLEVVPIFPYSFTDGVHIWTESNSVRDDFQVNTDLAGHIDSWWITLMIGQSGPGNTYEMAHSRGGQTMDGYDWMQGNNPQFYASTESGEMGSWQGGGITPSVPEPSTMLLLGSGLLGLVGLRRKFKK